jgi:hypothetical protein
MKHTFKAVMKALNGSIAKWRRLSKGRGEDLGTDNCPLCWKFIGSWCEHCPVKACSGWPNCQNTPFTEWARHHRRLGSRERTAYTPMLRRLAKKEYEYLLKVREQFKWNNKTKETDNG